MVRSRAATAAWVALTALVSVASCVTKTPTSDDADAGRAGSGNRGGSGALGGTGGVGRAGNPSDGGDTARGGTETAGGAPAEGGDSTSGGGNANGSAGDDGSGMAGAKPDGGASGGSSGTGGAAGAGGAAPITAKAAAAAMGKGVNLGQMFENSQHPQTLESASAKIDAYYAKGFRNVRIPITWTEPIDGTRLVKDPAVGAIDREHPRLAVIASIVDYALSKPDLFVVINAHHEKALKTNGRGGVLERLWADISDVFGKRNHRLLFEILNEPHRDDDSAMPAATLRDMTSKAYAKIRAVDPQRIVIIGGNQWFGAAEVPAVWTTLSGVGGGNDPYVMATFHHYNPWEFCGDNQGSYDDAWTDANLSTPMETMLAWANSVGKGMPVYIGEWGVGWGSRYEALECNNIRQWYQKMHTAHAALKNMPTAVWDDGGWFKIYDHEKNRFDNNLADCISGTCEWTGAERFNAGCE